MENTTRGKRLLDALIREEGFSTWQSEAIDAGGYSRDSDKRDRFERCYEAAENGADGSTYREHLDDMRAYISHRVYHTRNARLPFRGERDRVFDAVIAVINEIEKWHETRGSLDQEVG